MVALNLFLNNHFEDARERMAPCAEFSMYHALGYSTIMYCQAVMTFDMADIESAIQTIKKALVLCSKKRKKVSMLSSLSKVAGKSNYVDLTDEEVHAELIYAECLLMRALLTFVQDENLISFVKGGLKIRECYKVYKECGKILAQKKWQSEAQRIHFESGVRMGVGSFNLLISLLPAKISKLLEFVGFSGNKKLGLSELQRGSEMLSSLRGPMCSIFLISYHTVICYVLGIADGDIDLASRVLHPCLQNYPKGAMFLFFAGRIEEVRGNIEKAIVKFEDSIESQQEWKQFHHLCFWELMWCHVFRCDWLMGMKYAERLCKESRWSKATYTYLKASFLMMCEDQTEDTRAHIDFLMGEVPKLKQRIAGKSIPIEKFCVYKAKRFQDQNGHLTLPALELIFAWNGFSIVGKKPELLEPLLLIVEKTLNQIVTNKDSSSHYMDDYCLALLLKGVCLQQRGMMLQAEQCFLEVISNEKQIKHDTYLVPYAVVEQAILCLHQERFEDVKNFLQKAKKNYKSYLLESRLHFRIHATNLILHARQNSNSHESETSTSTPPGNLTPQESFSPNDVYQDELLNQTGSLKIDKEECLKYPSNENSELVL
ncbi:hypothetical protein ACJMK2_040986 [Sinanodonta woodiana]|uniref:Tetratricopeptide repeat protein 39B n=1 Tax=Sinanodonta woodiana TaxID=1069815 RepID=A0ABD3W2P3_SINWO